MIFPGHIVRLGEPNPDVVKAIAKRLGELGYSNSSLPGTFDANFKSLVKLYQSRNHDVLGRPLLSDGEVGPATWGALFGVNAVSDTIAKGSGLAQAALEVAMNEIDVLEDPIGSNKGKRVEEYLASTGLPGGFFWCMAFVHFCFQEASRNIGVANPFPKTASCVDAWNKAKNFRITKTQAIQNPNLIVPGAVFILDFGGGHGHTGFVISSSGGALQTVEGNTASDGSSNGIGVFRLNRRNVANGSLKGFIIVP